MRRWQTIRSNGAPRHLHPAAYVSVVMSGGYEEAGDLGRFFLEPGDVLFHERFESHLNRFEPGGVTVLNLPLAEASFQQAGFYQISDLDAVVRLAESDPKQAAECLRCIAKVKVQSLRDWPDDLASAIRRDPFLKLSEWACAHGMENWTVTRGFRQVFGVTPEKFRARVRTTLALHRVHGSTEPLTVISAATGFSDQAHMCRSIRGLTGTSASALRNTLGRFRDRETRNR